jgi:signal transduction histidine kinase
MWVCTNTDIHDQRGLDEEKFLLEFAGDFATYKTGAEFFDALVSYVAKKTGADYAFIGELTEKEKKHFTIKTTALAAQGKLVPNIEYPLPDGPCEQVIRGTVYSYPQHCKITFPKNQTLVQFNVEGYVGYPLFTSDGTAMGLIAVMHEKEIANSEYVSALLKVVGKRAEFEMERNIFRKTLLNANYELQVSVAELGKTNIQLDRFAFVASHDLQEPLRKIRTFSGLLQSTYNDVLPAEAKTFLNKIDGASTRMSNLVDDLLTYSRVANLEKLFAPTDLNETLKNVISDLDLLFEQTNATIQNDVLPTITAIPLQMNQLFGNLIGNAIKYVKEGVAPVIRISSHMLTEKEIELHSELNSRTAYCEIIFQDNGIGFDQKYEEQIFTIFQRLHGKTEYTGTGIGLALCKKIAENHNGKIFAHAKENEGAAFHVILPMTQTGG